MDAERKMLCTWSDNTAGGLSRAVLTADHSGITQEIAMFNWVLAGGERFRQGATYGVAVWEMPAQKPDTGS